MRKIKVADKRLSQKLSQITGNISPKFRCDVTSLCCKKVNVARPSGLPQNMAPGLVHLVSRILALGPCFLVSWPLVLGLLAVGLLACTPVGLFACWVVGLLACWLAGLLACWLVGLFGVLACWLLKQET